MTSYTTLFLASELRRYFNAIPDPENSDSTMASILAQIKVMDAINAYNSRMHVSEIRFVPKNNAFGLMEKCDSMFFGIIAETVEHVNGLTCDDGDVWIEEIGESAKYYKAVTYVIIVPPGSGSRNAVVTQQVFPALFTLIGENLKSPGLTLTDRPIYLIDLNISGHQEQPSSINRSFMAVKLSGMAIICPFHKRFELEESLSLQEYSDICSQRTDECIIVDDSRHARIIPRFNHLFKTVSNESETGIQTIIQIEGSSEKFFATVVLGGYSLAKRLGYEVDLSELHDAFKNTELYCSRNNSKPQNKFYNLIKILNYMEKKEGRQ